MNDVTGLLHAEGTHCKHRLTVRVGFTLGVYARVIIKTLNQNSSVLLLRGGSACAPVCMCIQCRSVRRGLFKLGLKPLVFGVALW